MKRCSYAACTKVGTEHDPNYPDWQFCKQHYLEHRADMYGEKWPRMIYAFPVQLAPCGTSAAQRRHYRNKDPQCVVCTEAEIRRRNPHNPNGYRGSWYRPEAS